MTTPAVTLWRKLAGSGTKFFRDYIVLAGGQVIAKLLGFAAFAWLARILDPVDYGAVEYVVGLAVFFAMLVDGGLNVIGTRRVGRDPGELALLAFQIPAARMLLALAAVPLMILIATQLMKATVPVGLVWLFALSLLSTPWRQQWLFQATERMAATAFADMLRMAVFAVLIWALVRGPGHLLAVGWAEITAVVAMTAYCLVVQHHRGPWQIVEQRLQPLMEERQPMLHPLMLAARADRLVQGVIRPCRAKLDPVVLAKPGDRCLVEQHFGHRCKINGLQLFRGALC